MVRKLQTITSLAFFLLAWEAIARSGIFPRALVPAATDVAAVFLDGENLSTILQNYGITALRATVGFFIGLIGGIGLGAIFSVRSMHNYIQPIATLFFAVPSVAWIPLLIVWIGVKEFELPVVASFLCSFPPVLYGMINALRTADRDQIDVAMVLGAKPSKVLKDIVLPQAFLKIMPLIKTEAVMTWKVVFVTEMVVLSSGLGYLAMVYATTLEMSMLIAVVSLLAINTLVIVRLIDHIEKELGRKWLGDKSWSKLPLGP